MYTWHPRGLTRGVPLLYVNAHFLDHCFIQLIDWFLQSKKEIHLTVIGTCIFLLDVISLPRDYVSTTWSLFPEISFDQHLFTVLFINKFQFQDVDECRALEHPCGPNAVCRNENPGYTCECPTGYKANPSPKVACDQVRFLMFNLIKF